MVRATVEPDAAEDRATPKMYHTGCTWARRPSGARREVHVSGAPARASPVSTSGVPAEPRARAARPSTLGLRRLPRRSDSTLRVRNAWIAAILAFPDRTDMGEHRRPCRPCCDRTIAAPQVPVPQITSFTFGRPPASARGCQENASGLSAAPFADEQGLKAKALSTWRWRLRTQPKRPSEAPGLVQVSVGPSRNASWLWQRLRALRERALTLTPHASGTCQFVERSIQVLRGA